MSVPAPNHHPHPGDILLGKYRVESVLGQGAMGIVVAAHHLQLDERVALKFLLSQSASNPEAVARFVREARAAIKIKSDHLVRVSDVGTLEDGAPYLVMEYLEGCDLSAELKRRGKLPIPEVVDWVLQACEAIAEAHALGIVHRDLKPANLFLTRRAGGLGWIKVLDFGISKVVGALNEPSMTSTSAVMGSPYYMSPEQFRSSRDVDARTDIWALGVTIYELLSGATPFRGETIPELCINIAVDPARSFSDVHAEVPHRLEAVIRKCLEKDREHRFLNMGELALALAEFGTERGRASARHVVSVVQGADQSTTTLALSPSSGPPNNEQGHVNHRRTHGGSRNHHGLGARAGA